MNIKNPPPKHLAIIMDGNGRWAKNRFMPRLMGHKQGLKTLENLCKSCVNLGIDYLTVFAFSTENWRRPKEEISFLMELFLMALRKKVELLHKNNLRLKVIGSRENFSENIVKEIIRAEELTKNNTGMTLTIAADYGGRWDILNAVNKILKENPNKTNITEEELTQNLALNLADIPEPDLFIRTGGEARISNFLLWQMAYTEFYFTDTFWPDFDENELLKAFASYQKRERRFGRTSEQLEIRNGRGQN